MWEDSGLNVGYWSSSCEEWFLKRLELIQNGKMDVRTKTEWKAALKFYKQTGFLCKHNEKESSEFLGRCL